MAVVHIKCAIFFFFLDNNTVCLVLFGMLYSRKIWMVNVKREYNGDKQREIKKTKKRGKNAYLYSMNYNLVENV